MELFASRLIEIMAQEHIRDLHEAADAHRQSALESSRDGGHPAQANRP